ncbi:hypothetical protein SLE2022_186830 [Rubroshorea leprosula]
MEDDDEFGDLYTDVLRPISSASAPLPHQPSVLPAPLHSPIDLNLQSDPNDILYGASHPNPHARNLASSSADSIPGLQTDRDSAAKPRVLDTRDVKLTTMASKEEIGGGNDVKFDIEEGNGGIDDLNSDPIIPGLSESGNPDESGRNDLGKENTIGGGEVCEEGEGDDWDSDSEDDLQIVLNDNSRGPMSMERGVMDEDDDDDEDGEPLVIVADGDANQGMEEQDWGEEAAQAAEGDRKEGGEPGKPNSGVGGGVIVPKIGYSSHGYHPFHSQFKYVRPGAAPMPGASTGTGGVPGQFRPVVNMGPMAGRARGEWRPAGMKTGPPMQKGFHPGFGMPWGNSMGRGFGGGMEFTLPSHKTIFDVDIDTLEEKPWKHPGVDISDFFNFGLNEESWKDYCKQLEQRRLETTMQSRIRVYESGRTEQDYDPDLPPELAAATGQEVPIDNANLGKSDGGKNDVTKGTARVRPALPTGRAIQVEGGFGERLPSIDTRPPRIRDSDAIIEIVCHDFTEDDSSTGNGILEKTENDRPRQDLRGDNEAEDDIGQARNEYFDGFQAAYRCGKREVVEKRMRFMNSVHDNIPEGNGILPYPVEAHLQYGPGSRGQSPMYPSGNFGTAHDDRNGQGRTPDRSLHITHNRSRQDKFSNNQEEESNESLGGRSPNSVRDTRELSMECKTVADEKLVSADGSPVIEKDEVPNKTVKDENSLPFFKKQKAGSQVEQGMIEELDEVESKTARSSENSKARSGSSRDYQKWQDGAEDEVVQDRGSTRMWYKKDLDESDQSSRSKDHDGRHEAVRSQMVAKGGENYYPKREFDLSSSHNLHVKTDGFDRQRECEITDNNSQGRDDDPCSRKSRTEDLRKRERDDEIDSRHRLKVRETERSDKDDHLQSRKQLDNGSNRVRHGKDVGLRYRERDDNLRSRYEVVDDYHSKRRKDEEYLRRDHAEKEEMFHSNRESSSRRKRERDEILDQRKKDGQQRIRENFEELHSVRHKDEVWLQSERGERQREREDWPRLKQSHEDNLSNREREGGRNTMKSGRGSEDKAWVGHVRSKDDYKGSDREYQLKETVRHGEQGKRRDRVEDESFSRHRGREDVYARGNQLGNDERKARQDKSSTQNDRALDASDNQRAHEKKRKEGMRKNRESEGGDPNTLNTSKRNREDIGGNINEMGLKSTNAKNETAVHRNSSRKHREDASSDDEQESRRGRSKLERWTSHKERDYSINSKSSASLKFKEIDKNNNVGSSEPIMIPDEAAKSVEPTDNQHPTALDESAGDPEIKDADTKPLEDRHLDTVEKLKKRSERFKLPMPIEKDPLAIKKMESEALPSAKSETPADSEIKPERPARKRRWISS